MTDNSDDNKVYTVKDAQALDCGGERAARPPEIYHFDSREEAEAFAKAEQARWDDEYREWCRRTAEYERRNSDRGRP